MNDRSGSEQDDGRQEQAEEAEEQLRDLCLFHQWIFDLCSSQATHLGPFARCDHYASLHFNDILKLKILVARGIARERTMSKIL